MSDQLIGWLMMAPVILVGLSALHHFWKTGYVALVLAVAVVMFAYGAKLVWP